MTATGAPAAPVREADQTRPLNAPGLFVGVAIFGAAAIGVLVFTMLRTPQIPAVVSLDYTKVAGSVLTADERQHDSRLLASALARRLPGLDVTVPDFAAAGFVLDGGSVHPLIGRPGIVAIYRNALQDLVVWHQFAGSTDDLPSTTDVRERDGRRYFVHRKSTNVLVFWQDGARVDVLTSSLPAEQVMALAFATR
jgi:anti-sigma factor RsiW